MNTFNETEEQALAFKKLTEEVTEKLKNLTYSNAQRLLEHVKFNLENSLVLS